MSKTRLQPTTLLMSAVAVAALAAGCACAVAADDAQSASERQQPLIEVLLSDAPKAEKAITCKKLTLCGDKDAVPALVPLLADEELASWARIPLEAIPGPEADAALRDAMGKLEGRLLIGVINSIGVRRDSEAVAALAEKLKDGDADVAAAAAAALGKIGGAPATKALEAEVAGGRPEIRSAAAKGLVRCAQQALASGDSKEAVRLYDLVRQSELPQQRIVEATRGAILARGAAGLPLLVEQLQSDDREMFDVGLGTAREMGGPAATKAVVAELEKLRQASAPKPAGPEPETPVIKSARYGAGDRWVDVTNKVAAAVNDGIPTIEASNDLAGDPAPSVVKELQLVYTLGGKETVVTVAEGETLELQGGVRNEPPHNPRESALIYTLGDLDAGTALPAVREAAARGSRQGRVAAVRVLGQIGDATVVPILLDAAESPGELAEAALESLDKLEGDAVDKAIARGLPDATGERRAVLIQIVGSRRIESAVPELVKAADSEDAAIRLAAIRALGATAGFDRLDVLIGRLLEPRDAREAEAAKGALLAACTRMPDRDATAAKLLAAMRDAPAETQATLLELVKEVGGAKALAGVAAAARSSDEAMRDLGSRLLGEWMDTTAAPVLLDLAKTSAEDKYKVRALRGYLRIVRQFDVPEGERIDMCEAALKAAERPEEKKLALEVLGRYPTAQGLSLAAEGVRDPALRGEAGAAAVAIAEKIVKQEPAAVADAMKQVIAAGGDPKVVGRAKALLQQAERILEEKR